MVPSVILETIQKGTIKIEMKHLSQYYWGNEVVKEDKGEI
jgi:hypothetical protein